MSKRAIFLDGKRSSAAASSTTTTTTTWQVSNGGDDGSGAHGSSTMSAGNAPVNSGNEVQMFVVNIGYYGFFRFLNVGITQGATIDAAKLTLRTTDSSGGGAEVGDLDLYTFKVDALDVDDSTRPTDANDVNESATTTSAVVDWTLTSSVSDDADLDTPEIKTVLQEVVDRALWSSGNDITFRVYNEKVSESSPTGLSDCQLSCFSYDQNTSKAAKLVVEYTQ